MLVFILGVIGNIFASYIYDTLRTQDSKSPPLVLIVQPEILPSTRQQTGTIAFDQRALNRERAIRIIALLFFFGVTLYLLKESIHLPILTGHLADNALDLGQVKIIGWFTDVSVSMSSVGTWATIIAMLLYLPVLLLGDRLLVTVKQWYDKFWPVTFNAWIAMRFGTFLFLSLIISGLVTYLVTDLSILWALAAPFIALLIIIIFAVSNDS